MPKNDGKLFFSWEGASIFLSSSCSFKNSLKACGYLSQDLPRDAHHLGSISKLQKKQWRQPMLPNHSPSPKEKKGWSKFLLGEPSSSFFLVWKPFRKKIIVFENFETSLFLVKVDTKMTQNKVDEN